MLPISARSLRPARSAWFLGAFLLPAAVLSAPASAQVLIYEGPYGPPPAYGYEVPARVPRYPILPPREVMNIVRGMGYWQVSLPRLAGGTYVVTAVDEEGPVVLRVNAATGRVVSARTFNGAQTIAVPDAPRRTAVPPHNVPPPVARLAPAPLPPSAPLPPPRPPEASMAALSPAPAEPQAPADAARGGAVTGSAPNGGAVNPGAGNTGAGAPPPAPQQATAPAAPPASTAAPTAAPTGAAATAPSPGATGKPQEAQASAPQAAPVNRKAGVGTGTAGSPSAGTASVLSRPKPAN